jgi:RNA polymerase sigma-70 factor (ECF subfamily)
MTEFDRYRSRPSAETLEALLRAWQGTVYTLCVHVLRHPENARDVSQQVFLRLLDALPRISDGEHLKRWIHLVCFRESLNFQKKLKVRMDYERARAAEAAAANVPHEDALEIHEHIASLRDDLRALVVDYFFERKTLPALAVERGCSSVAVWKKLERAKEKLRESLSKAGFSAGASCLEGFLTSLRPVAPPDGLLGPAILAKAGRLAASGAPAAAALGGIAMTGKGISAAAVVAIALLCLSVGMSAGVVVGSSRARPAPSAPDSRDRRERPSAESAARPANALPEPASPRPALPDGLPARAAAEDLPGRLEQFRQWLVAQKPRSGDKTEEYCRTLMREWKELKPLVLQNPETYAAFLREKENEAICSELLSILNPPRISPRGSVCNIAELNLSSPVRDVLLDFLASGSKEQRRAALQILGVGRLAEADAPLVGPSLAMISDPDPDVRREALGVFHYNPGMLTDGDVEVFRRALQGSQNPDLTQGCLNVLESMKGAVAENLLVEEAGRLIRQKSITKEFAWTLERKVDKSGAENLPRYRTLLADAIATGPEAAVLQDLAQASLHLPLDQAMPLLEQGYSQAPTTELRDRIAKTIQKIRSGETRRAILERDLGRAISAPFASVDLPFELLGTPDDE